MRVVANAYFSATRPRVKLAAVLLLMIASSAFCKDAEIASKLGDFDSYVEKVRKDWNTAGIGVGIVSHGKLVFAKGYGYRDYGQTLPFTADTLCPIASNTKLFTAVAAGMLVEEGKLEWDKPVHDDVPAIRFSTDPLTSSVTLRDMLSHRTGVTRHDSIWYKSEFTRRELFDRLRYLEPQEPLRERFLYNNLMYCAVGYSIELQSGEPWEQFVRERILDPLGMNTTCYSISDMLSHPDHGVPFTERRDSFDLYQIPYYQDTDGMAPCGAIISNIDEMSHWLIALMNDGKYEGKQVLPHSVLKETLAPAIALPNILGETMGYWELLNPVYGMGRQTVSYRGHLLTYHGGDLPGFHSQVSFMPQDDIGVIVFVIGDHASPLINIIGYNAYERLLGLDPTPWSQRRLEMRLKDKKADTAARAKADEGRVSGTRPSHKLADYLGEYVHPAYGTLKITLKDEQLHFDFHKLSFPLTHFHYDRFDTPDDEQDGKWSVNFRTNPQGDVDEIMMSLDEAAVVFTRKPDALDPKLLADMAGLYEMPNGMKLTIVAGKAGALSMMIAPGAPVFPLIPVRGTKFRDQHFPDVILEFVVENGRVTALKQKAPTGEISCPKK
jgi:CubicO group peptidase (beta-lactamase class C family)